MKKILLIGSTQYKEKFTEWKNKFEAQGCIVKIPAFDDFDGATELDILKYNRDLVEWADEVGLIYDGRSIGTIFDFGMVFYSRKPLKILYYEEKSFKNAFFQYEVESQQENIQYVIWNKEIPFIQPIQIFSQWEETKDIILRNSIEEDAYGED